MRRAQDEFDGFGESDEDDRDAPLASDQDRHGDGSDDFEIVACPYCGKSISDLAEVCPHCRSFISREDRPGEPRPLWVTLVVVLLLIALTIGVVSFR